MMMIMIIVVALVGLTTMVNGGCSLDRIKPIYCYSEEEEIQNCPTIPVVLECDYCKNCSSLGLPDIKPAPSMDVTPGLPSQLNVKTYFISAGADRCVSVFNFSWKVPADASYRHLKGFLLNISRNETSSFYHRTFFVDMKNWTNFMIEPLKVTFYYDCFIPMPNTFHRIQLHSLPEPPTSSGLPSKFLTKMIQTPNYNEFVDDENSANWKSIIWITPDVDESSVEVCFTTAPTSFLFNFYVIHLVKSNILKEINRSFKIKVDETMSHAACHTFENVCPDVYDIQIEPVSDDVDGSDSNLTGCVCKIESKCTKFCSSSTLEGIDMTESACRIKMPLISQEKIKLLKEENDYRVEEHSMAVDASIVAGSILGAVAFVFFIIGGFVVWRRWRKKEPRGTLPSPPPNLKLPSRPNPILVLLIYASDNDLHIDVVRSLAFFLRERCHCHVFFDEWCREDIRRIGNQQVWSMEQVRIVDYVIFVLSDDAYRRYDDCVGRGKIDSSVIGKRDSVLEDVFLPVAISVGCDLVQVMALETKRKPSERRQTFYQVRFPYTPETHRLNESFGEIVELPREVEYLIASMHGSKNQNGDDHDGDWRKPLLDFDYTLRCPEGQRLEEAIARVLQYNNNQNSNRPLLDLDFLMEGERLENDEVKRLAESSQYNDNNNGDYSRETSVDQGYSSISTYSTSGDACAVGLGASYPNLTSLAMTSSFGQSFYPPDSVTSSLSDISFSGHRSIIVFIPPQSSDDNSSGISGSTTQSIHFS